MNEIAFTVSPCEESGVLVASWDASEGGGITTQGGSMDELRANVREAVACHFEDGEAAHRLNLPFRVQVSALKNVVRTVLAEVGKFATTVCKLGRG